MLSYKEVLANYQEITKFVKGTFAAKAPVIPISAQLKYNIEVIIEIVVEGVPVIPISAQLKYNDNDLRSVWNSTELGSMEVGTDGSHQPDSSDGAGGFIMANNKEKAPLVRGGGKCFLQDDMSSMTTEHVGII